MVNVGRLSNAEMSRVASKSRSESPEMFADCDAENARDGVTIHMFMSVGLGVVWLQSD